MPKARRAPRVVTLEMVAAAYLRRRASEARGKPLERYQRDPTGYAADRLHITLIPWQAKALVALAKGIGGEARPRVTVRSGQKCGKTTWIIVAALWFYECFPESTVYLCAAIVAQTDNVLWKEMGVRMRHAAAHGTAVGGKLGYSAASGLIAQDGSQSIKGLSGREIEALAGLSGRQLLIVDEASHLPEKKAQVFAGNMLGGGGAMAFTSNPTKNAGPFYESFHNDAEYWQTFHVDGEDVAAWQAESGIRIPYTTNLQTIAEAKERYGTDSPFWFLRVKGEWLRYEAGRANPMAVLELAIARWAAMPDDGPLSIGYNPAGPTDDGDKHAWAIVRGNKCLQIHRRRGLTEDEALRETLDLLRLNRKEGDDEPRIAIDAEGPVGFALYTRLRAEAERRRREDRANGFAVIGVKASSKYVHDKSKFERVRSEIVWVLSMWLREAGIPNDHELQGELYEWQWRSLPSGQLECTPKTEIRDRLGRSPDSGDALCLAVWRPSTWQPAPQEAASASVDPWTAAYGGTFSRGGPMDPYASTEWTRG